jgi:hypothetical protein
MKTWYRNRSKGERTFLVTASIVVTLFGLVLEIPPVVAVGAILLVSLLCLSMVPRSPK